MSICDELPERLQHICLGTVRKADGKAFTLEERKWIVGRRLKVDPETIELPESEIEDLPTALSTSRIGTILKEVINQKSGSQIPCGACKRAILQLNNMTSAEVQAQKSTIARDIVARAATQATKWYQRLLAHWAPELVAGEVEKWIDEACRVNDG